MEVDSAPVESIPQPAQSISVPVSHETHSVQPVPAPTVDAPVSVPVPVSVPAPVPVPVSAPESISTHVEAPVISAPVVEEPKPVEQAVPVSVPVPEIRSEEQPPVSTEVSTAPSEDAGNAA